MKCKYCNNEFNQKNKNHMFCTSKCKKLYYREHKKEIMYICSNCYKKYTSKSQKRYNNNFCSKTCENEFKDTKMLKTCEICGVEFRVIPSMSKQRFCSIKCQSEWQSINRRGDKSPTYNHNISIEDRTLTCRYCREKFIVTNANLINIKKFCNMTCSRKWYSEIWSQSEEWREKSRIRGAKCVKNSKKTLTKPHIIINNFLIFENIKFENEKVFDYYSSDIFLTDYNLIIEIMGDYWHKHHKYFNADNVCKKDGIKDKFIYNKYNIKILYLWESDIKNNLDVCHNLIKLYIKNNGILENYHSFNYNIYNGDILLNKIIEFPYMDRL